MKKRRRKKKSNKPIDTASIFALVTAIVNLIIALMNFVRK